MEIYSVTERLEPVLVFKLHRCNLVISTEKKKNLLNVLTSSNCSARDFLASLRLQRPFNWQSFSPTNHKFPHLAGNFVSKFSRFLLVNGVLAIHSLIEKNGT